MTSKRSLDDAEAKARMTVASIVGILYDVPVESLPEVQAHLDRALIEARESVEKQQKTGILHRAKPGAVAGILLVCAFILCGASCPTEGDRQTLHQTREAGRFVKEYPDAPAPVKQAGHDVESNAATLQKNLVGEPQEPVKPYSPEASKEARDRSDKEAEEPPAILKWAAKVVTPIVPWAAPVLLGAWGVFERLRKAKALQRLTAIYQGVETVKAKIGNGQYAEAITDAMRTVAGNMNVYNEIKAELHALKEVGKVSEVRPPTSSPV